jgi:hypothetical protein
MKKISIILVMLFWCNVGFALTQQEAIDKFLSDRKLDTIEGLWSFVDNGQTILYYKSGNTYQFYDLGMSRYDPGRIQKGSDNYYYGTGVVFYLDNPSNLFWGTKVVNLNGNVGTSTISFTDRPTAHFRMQRVWPTDLASYNAKFKTKKDIADEEKVVADMVADAQKTCKVLGFKEESEKFADCALKLYTKKVDELVAKKKTANALTTQSQTSTTTQSSGSNSVTIYDPVRDSRALMKQGQKMLSGACTHGIDC